jgi:hypothetical protein
MQRLACLFLVISAAACGGGSETGEATLSNTQPPVKSAAAKPFTGPDGAGAMVLGWKVLLYKDDPGSDCTAASTIGTIGIYSNMAAGSNEQALLTTGGITIVTTSPPMVIGSAAANFSLDNVSIQSGVVTLTEFHLTPDAKHADRITGTISAGGTNGGGDVSVDGSFTAPICED